MSDVVAWTELDEGLYVAHLVWAAEPGDAVRMIIERIAYGRIRRERGRAAMLVAPPERGATWPRIVADGSGLPLCPFGFLIPRSVLSGPRCGPFGGSASDLGAVLRDVGWGTALSVTQWRTLMRWSAGRAWLADYSNVIPDPKTWMVIVPNPRYAGDVARAVDQLNYDRYHRWMDAVDVQTGRFMRAALDWRIATVAVHAYWRADVRFRADKT